MPYFGYWAKQDTLPVAKLAEVLAEFRVLSEDVRFDNYEMQRSMLVAGYTRTFVENLAEYAAEEYSEASEHDKVMVDVTDFVFWAYEHQIPMPDKFLAVIDQHNKVLKGKSSEVEKKIIQGIACALWDIYPETTIEEMMFHHAIQVYGRAERYSEYALRKWLRAVDPRPSKTGPKKKN